MKVYFLIVKTVIDLWVNLRITDSVWIYKFLSQLGSFVFSLSIKNLSFPQFPSGHSCCVTVPYAISERTFRLSCNSLDPVSNSLHKGGFLASRIFGAHVDNVISPLSTPRPTPYHHTSGTSFEMFTPTVRWMSLTTRLLLSTSEPKEKGIPCT